MLQYATNCRGPLDAPKLSLGELPRGRCLLKIAQLGRHMPCLHQPLVPGSHAKHGMPSQTTMCKCTLRSQTHNPNCAGSTQAAASLSRLHTPFRL